MKELLSPLDKNLYVTCCRITDDEIIFDVFSTSNSVSCSECGHISTSIHDFYLTHIQDLPIQGKSVYLNLLVRRFKC